MKTFNPKSALIFACIIFNLVYSNISVAQGKSEMDGYLQEFFAGRTVFLQEKNEIQFTLMPLFAKSKLLSIPLSLEYGITDRLQVEVEVPYIISYAEKQHTVRGIGNTELGIMYNIIKSNQPFSLSAGVNIPLQTSGRQIRDYNSETSWETFAIAARQFGHAQVHANLAAEFPEGAMVLNYGISSVLNFGRCSATFELSSNKEEQRIFYFTPGFIWSHPSGFEFGMGFSKSMNGFRGDWSAVGMLIYEFSLFRD